ncbi:MAG: hypothetical protein WCP22_04655 [Chlamydiota bacterium]
MKILRHAAGAALCIAIAAVPIHGDAGGDVTASPTPVSSPAPTPEPLLRVNVSPAGPKLFGPIRIDVDIEALDGSKAVDAWGAIFLSGGGVRYLTGPPPCSLSAEPAPIARSVTLPDGYRGAVVSVPSIPLGYEGTHKIVIGLIDHTIPQSFPSPSSPYNFIDSPRYWDEEFVTVATP